MVEGRSPRVLVVEDDEDIALALQRSLRLEGYDVRISRDGSVALDDFKQFLPDLVLLDLGLPKIDGITVAERIRTDGDVPILMLTARDALESRVEGLDSGADARSCWPACARSCVAARRAARRTSRWATCC
jgi:two-component system response regulator MprA